MQGRREGRKVGVKSYARPCLDQAKELHGKGSKNKDNDHQHDQNVDNLNTIHVRKVK